MAGRFLDDPRWRRRLKCLLFVGISSLILAAGLFYQWFSDRQAQTLVSKIFTTLFAVTSWATLLFCIWMNRPYMAPLREHGKAAQNSARPDPVEAARVKNEASQLIRRIDAIRLRAPGTAGECAEDSQRPP